MEEVRINRNFKDSLFRMIFSGKAELLSLYNAINGSSYKDPEALTVTTIDSVIYMGMKNDLSFLIDDCLNLYEAQSTWNPNMPLRGLFYFSRLYQAYLEERQLNLYSSVRLSLPYPQYIVLYNGTDRKMERTELKLSDSFSLPEGERCFLECTALVINVNFGCNSELMESCRKLYEYAWLVERVREKLRSGLKLRAAVDRAVEDAIGNGILKEFLLKHRREVMEMILEEYDQEKHVMSEKEISFREGEKEGKIKGEAAERARMVALMQRLKADGRTDDILRLAERPECLETLLGEYRL